MGIGKIQKLGAGVGYRPQFHEAFLGEGAPPAEVSWVEVITENFLPGAGNHDTLYLQNLRSLREKFPIALHGVGLSLGSAEPLDRSYLKQLAWLEREIEPWIVSDHLCWTGIAGENLFDLLPLPCSKEALTVVAEKIQHVQELLQRPIAVENITYYSIPAGGEMPEAEFLNELARTTGCRFLLDINNVYVNSVNFSTSPYDFLNALDLRHLAQVHLAGHARGSNGLLLDTHGAPVAEEVWRLFEKILARTGAMPAMIERDENIPEWSEMAPELLRLRALLEKGARHDTARMAAPSP